MRITGLTSTVTDNLNRVVLPLYFSGVKQGQGAPRLVLFYAAVSRAKSCTVFCRNSYTTPTGLRYFCPRSYVPSTRLVSKSQQQTNVATPKGPKLLHCFTCLSDNMDKQGLEFVHQYLTGNTWVHQDVPLSCSILTTKKPQGRVIVSPLRFGTTPASLYRKVFGVQLMFYVVWRAWRDGVQENMKKVNELTNSPPADDAPSARGGAGTDMMGLLSSMVS